MHTTATPPRTRAALAMRQAALRLRAAAGDRVALAFDAREDWHYVPRSRPGLAIGSMTEAARRATWELLGGGLSPAGRTRVEQTILLEGILGQLEGNPELRDPGDYHVALFGPPSADQPWGWRIEGHHLSLHFTLVGDRIATTPAFFGSHPARVRNGPHRGLRVLAAEEDLGRALFLSLSEDQRRRAAIADQAPPDLVTGASRRVSLARAEGIAASELLPAQREALVALIAVYARDLAPELAGDHMARIRAAGVERLHFAWAGSAEPGESHYYRVHGPTHLVEYDNRGGDHVHSVFRDLAGDFGGDLLADHLRQRHGAR